MSEELKPCPFCGGTNIEDDVYTRDGRVVVCHGCRAGITRFNPNGNERAIEAWNTRTPAPTHNVIGPAEAWELFDSRRFLHGHRESMKESFELIVKDLIVAPAPAELSMGWRPVSCLKLRMMAGKLRKANPADETAALLEEAAADIERLALAPAPTEHVVGTETVFASRHNDEIGECETVEIDPPKVAELRQKLSDPHPSHVRRFSDASSYDEVCTQCGATDIAGGGWGKLAEPCPSPQKPAATSIEAFEQEFPHHFWHVAKGKVSVGEPLYGALITDHRGIELANGESDKSANDAFSIAVAAFRAALSASEVEG